MDIAPIITSAVALLVPYLTKVGDGMLQKAGEDAWDKMKKLYQTIHNKFSLDKDDYAQQTLKRLEEKPSEERRQRALADILTEKALSEPEFAQELKRLVQDTIQDKNVGQFLTQVFGGEVGQILNINQAGNITFNENK